MSRGVSSVPASYRAQLHIANHDIKVFTRNGLDWMRRFRKVAQDADLINASSAVNDDEIVVPGQGGTDFAILQKSLTDTADNIEADRRQWRLGRAAAPRGD
ncbi:hypothetical protein CV770_13395 [Bradyrhizobium sp. AC87j1]|uniref:hypothetical protein n=1 Tax=Bradyrhizobium sp. AC87j1 TaxID=2055894 RepID=UPI000CECC462|nr:hypothetical protein [Bradyrhizobium sp. AC87j1]PPQ18933.1 hypothetical protein CV770_13395 [Bradyrhizobium sp. AC87j1]